MGIPRTRISRATTLSVTAAVLLTSFAALSWRAWRGTGQGHEPRAAVARPGSPSGPAPTSQAAGSPGVTAGLAVAAATESISSIESLLAGLRVSGPATHDNLEVFVLHARDARDVDDRVFITLDEGLRDGSVVVTEQSQEQVGQLEIENRSDHPLFLQEGDRVRGGKQDRTVPTSVVVGPHSGKQPLAVFCVEQGRWREGQTGRAFGATGALASKKVRLAAMYESNQGKVWSSVAQDKQALATNASAPSATSSLNEALDSGEVQRKTAPYLAALEPVLAGEKDAIGVAFAVNGVVEEVDLYPGPSLLGKLYPRLLASFATEALVPGAAPGSSAQATAADVLRFLREGDARSRSAQRVNEASSRGLVDYDAKVECGTDYDGKRVHWCAVGK